MATTRESRGQSVPFLGATSNFGLNYQKREILINSLNRSFIGYYVPKVPLALLLPFHYC